MKRKAIIFSAPSGSGKTTIVKHLLNLELNLEFSVSACSRQPRKNEVHGKDYYFLTVEEFKAGIDRQDFIEWEEVYKDHYYGTRKSELERIWDKGKQVIFDVDVLGGISLKNALGNDALSIFLQPPSIKALEQRLRDRSTDTEEKIRLRVDKASSEMNYADQFDVIIINDRLDDALFKAEEIVSEFLSS